MEGEVFTLKETIRYGVIRCVLEGKMTHKQAALSLKISKRQVQRLKQKVFQDGPTGILHGNKGRKPVHAFSDPFKDQVIEWVKTRYFDFNFSHLSEFLQEEKSVYVNRETLRLWLRPLGYGAKPRKKPMHRKRRVRSGREGEMLFLDGSPHNWFADFNSTLILCTDDASGKPLWGRFQPQEDLEGCLWVCLQVFQKYGLPMKFYLDKASQFTTTRHREIYSIHNKLLPTHFERAMEDLGIVLIFANSPQARGRAERINGSLQDRLISELRVKGITNEKEATQYLNQVFIPKYSKRFAVQPREQLPAWRKPPQDEDLRNILCRRFQRTVNNDNTISVDGTVIQLLPTRNHPHVVQAKVRANLWIDGSWHVFHPNIGKIPCLPIKPTAKIASSGG